MFSEPVAAHINLMNHEHALIDYVDLMFQASYSIIFYEVIYICQCVNLF